ncbi:hypothetical protein CGRA01v4_11772 [Colletotrichum graminicola]|nr:hypothetical protein CGRA01v4_11772 [Colletotrichum graminicola]
MEWQVGGECSRCFLVYEYYTLKQHISCYITAGIFPYRCNGTSPRPGHSVEGWHWYLTTLPCKGTAGHV